MQLTLRRCVAGITALSLIIIIVTALTSPIDRQVHLTWLPALALLILTLSLGLLFLAYLKLNLVRPRIIHILLIVSTLIALLIQVWLSLHIVAMGSLDPAAIRLQAAALAQGGQYWFRYFSWYPNNVNITLILAGLMKLTGQVQGNGFGHFLNLIGFIHIDGTILLIWWFLKRHRGQLSANTFLALSLLFVPFYWYALDFYTDIIVIIYPALLLTCVDLAASSRTKKRQLIWLTLGLLFFTIGYLIKGNTIVFGLATLFAWGLSRPTSRRLIGQLILTALIGGLLLIAGGHVSQQLAKTMGYAPNPASEFPTTSWTLMGLNPQSFGAYSQTDIDQTTRLGSASANQQAVNQAFKARLKQLGFIGLVKQFRQKIITMWSTGTVGAFLWPDHFKQVPKTYLKHQAVFQTLVANFTQVLYLFSLTTALIATLLEIRNPHFDQLLLQLSFLGILFLHLFFWEVEARYALLLIPFLLALAASSTPELVTHVALLKPQKKVTFSLLIFLLVANLWPFLVTRAWSRPQSISTPITNQSVPGYFQMSQLTLKPGQHLTQPLQIPEHFNTINCSDIAKTGTKVQLTLTKNSHEVSQARAPGLITSPTYLAAGQYQLKLKNISQQSVTVSVAHSPIIRLTTNPIEQAPNYYFKFSVTAQQNRPLVNQSARLISLLVIEILLISSSYYLYYSKN
ncbi:hypothetical protein AYR54_10570 [Loigolactobacillus backii]|uniref:hypothetical protein n=1 Tax=Loigolactobacillus backii TaxID=375175 RepID=UPI0007F12C9C|nr:hypothetical protein [Loigolactobacillus backii]ANK60687.1 hypothetical protein AYR52_10770 [Loigolactobacillus backii]ANK65640.1 hypothetical protein AYR54_10570 [Loigolactobacillus backii]ANK68116.1 hypothetical protein AYR55_10720 [Loigolactobacillus backii]OLF67839.1 hypothetical protein ACX53_12460 [Loigolactobacillus backii]PIO86670.1 hypothetical protein B8A32_05660 [Loigolactobacillus backii]